MDLIGRLKERSNLPTTEDVTELLQFRRNTL